MSYQNQHKLHDGRVVLYTRNGKPFFHARVKVDGVPGYKIASTKRRTLGEAARVAEEWYEDRRERARKGLQLKTFSFMSLWKQWRLSNEPLLSSHRLRYLDGTVARYFLPFFADRPVDAVNDRTIEEYWSWRIIPAQRTLDMEKSALRQILGWAQRNGVINVVPQIKPPKLHKGHEVVRRPAFEASEWNTLSAILHGWLGTYSASTPQGNAVEGGHSLHRFQRQMFSAYVLFLCQSGLRPNEARQLRWRDITEIRTKEEDRQLLLHISPSTKTGARDVVPEKMTKLVLQKLRKISMHTKTLYSAIKRVCRLITSERPSKSFCFDSIC